MTLRVEFLSGLTEGQTFHCLRCSVYSPALRGIPFGAKFPLNRLIGAYSATYL